MHHILYQSPKIHQPQSLSSSLPSSSRFENKYKKKEKSKKGEERIKRREKEKVLKGRDLLGFIIHIFISLYLRFYCIVHFNCKRAACFFGKI